MFDTFSETGQEAAFPTTQWTIILEAASQDPGRAQKALERLCNLYRQPIVNWFRRKDFHHDAEDRAHDFVVYLVEKRLLARIRPHATKFRWFLAASMKLFLWDCWDKDGAQKRGGDVVTVRLVDGEGDIGSQPDNDSHLDLDFALEINRRVMAKLAPPPELKRFIFQKDRGEPWNEVAERFGKKSGSIRQGVHRLRRRHWELFRDEVALIATPAEKADETKYLYELLFKHAPLEE